jgi:hypothetical protein
VGNIENEYDKTSFHYSLTLPDGEKHTMLRGRNEEVLPTQ